MTSEVASVHREQTLRSQFHSSQKCWCVLFMLMLSAYMFGPFPYLMNSVNTLFLCYTYVF